MLVEAYVDGASRGQGKSNNGISKNTTGEAACSAIICINGKKTIEYARGLGRRTNNEAEYEAVLLALLICSMADLKDPIIYSDSAVVVNQVTGKWQCKNAKLIPLLKSIEIIRDDGKFRFRIIQVPRDEVAQADSLVNKFLDSLEK